MSYEQNQVIEETALDIPEPPAGLSPRALSLWNSVLSEYDLRHDGLLILESACKALSRVAELEREFAADGDYVSVGSKYQPVVNPLLVEIRQTEKHVSDLLARLKLDRAEEDEKPEGWTIIRAKNAANTRWNRQKGA